MIGELRHEAEAAVAHGAAAQPAAETGASEILAGLRATLGRIEHAVSVLNEGIVWTDEQGLVQWCNPAFVRLTMRPLLALVGKPVDQALSLREEGEPVVSERHPVRRVLATANRSPTPSPLILNLEADRGGQVRHLEVYASSLRTRSGVSALMVIRDLTERRLAERWLEAESQRAELVRAVAACANQTESPEKAIAGVIELVSRFLGWPVARAFLSLDRSGLSAAPEIWFEQDAGGRFRSRVQAEGGGENLFELARAVAASPDPVHIIHALPPVAPGLDGLGAAIAFPVRSRGVTRAVLEFFGTGPVEGDASLLAVVEQIATHLAQVFERENSRGELLRAKQELERRVEERTAELTHLNSALMGEISNREKVQRALSESMRRHRSLLESVRDVVFSVSARGRVDSVNAAIEGLTGRERQEYMSARALRLVHPRDRRRAVDAFRRTLAGEAMPPFEIELCRADRTQVLVECSLTRQDAQGGQPISISGIARDVTESRRAQAALIIRDRAMAATSEGIIITDPAAAGNPIVFVNSGFERLTGYLSEEAVGQGLHLLTGAAAAEPAREILDRATAGGRAATVEMEASGKGGHTFWARLVLTPVVDEKGRASNFVAILSDISSQKAAERLKNELVSTVSHELRTPLTSLRGFAELMLEREYPPEKQRKFIQIIHKESTRLSNLINDFLDVQRMEAGRQEYKFAKAAVAPLLHDTAALFRPTSQIHEFVVDCAPGLSDIRGDLDRLRQVTTNLVSNAVKFSPAGGQVTLSASVDPVQPGMVQVSIADQGIGIPPEALDKLFQKFYRVDNTATRKIGGTGLGLSIVRQVIEAHGGRIWVESQYGLGSKFLFTLPVYAASQQTSTRPAPALANLTQNGPTC